MHTFNKVKTMSNSRFPQCQALERRPVCDYLNYEDRNCIYACNAAFTKLFGRGILFNAVIICNAGPEAEGSNPTIGLTLLWARNLFRGNFDHWQDSWEEAGQIPELAEGTMADL
jgi:hypothetical protein